MREYGVENFKFEVIEECSQEQLNIREIYYIELYDTIENGYNVSISENQQGKMSTEQVEEIVDLLMNTTLTQKEIGKKFNVSHSLISQINNGRMWYNEDFDYPIRGDKTKFNPKRCDCGVIIGYRSKMCQKCSKAREKKAFKRPERNELKKLIRNMSYADIANSIGVSIPTVRRWCKETSLPTSKDVIASYSDYEWEQL